MVAMLEPLNKETAAMLDPPTKSSGNSTLLLCKRFLLFSLENMAVDHVSGRLGLEWDFAECWNMKTLMYFLTRC